MANRKHLNILNQGVKVWNQWRQAYPEIRPDLVALDLSGADLSDSNLSGADLSNTDLSEADLSSVNFWGSNLFEADLSGADLTESQIYFGSEYVQTLSIPVNNSLERRKMDLSCINLKDAYLSNLILSHTKLIRTLFTGANLSRAIFTKATFRGAVFDSTLFQSRLQKANLSKINFNGVNLCSINFQQVVLHQASFQGTNLQGTSFHGANLSEANFSEANLSRVDFSEAILTGTKFARAYLQETEMRGRNFSQANLTKTDLSGKDLRKTLFNKADLSEANLSRANLSGAELTSANLSRATLVETNLTEAFLTDCKIYGISAWDVKLDKAKQENLVITPWEQPIITVDNIKVAQFIYLLLNNEEIRNVLDTITSKVVLILGRFTLERKMILDALRTELRERNYSPVLFDFTTPINRDFTETARTLAHLSRFILADVTDSSSVPQELQAIIPDLEVPVVPLLQETKKEYAMFVDFRKYHWVLPTYLYTDQATLIKALETEVIKPAEKKVDELVLEKAKRLEKL